MEGNFRHSLKLDLFSKAFMDSSSPEFSLSSSVGGLPVVQSQESSLERSRNSSSSGSRVKKNRQSQKARPKGSPAQSAGLPKGRTSWREMMTRTGQQPRMGDQGMISVDEPGATVAECDDQRTGLNAFDGRSPSDRGQGVFQQFVYEDQR